MTSLRIRKAQLQGEIILPPSKSHTLRAILFGALGSGTTRLFHTLISPDTNAMIEACRQFGAQITVCKEEITIQGTAGRVHLSAPILNAGNSGLVLRLCSAIGALSSSPFIVTGDHSIQTQRLMTPLLEGLSQLGASAVSLQQNGYAPIRIQGPLQGGDVQIDGADSQPVSALLIASCFLDKETNLFVKNAGEKPWVALTLDWLDRLGIPYCNKDFSHYRLFGNASYSGFDYTIPGDLSSAAFPVAAALITRSELLINKIDLTDCQGDKELLFLLEKMGARFEIDSEKKTLFVKKSGPLSAIRADINNYIDALPVLAVIACFALGETHIYNAAVAKHKECNRIHCIATELKKMGALITETDDGLIVKGSPLTGACVSSHQDHRLALSLSVAALGAEGETTITSIECIGKTFPSFVEDFNRLGARITCL